MSYTLICACGGIVTPQTESKCAECRGDNVRKKEDYHVDEIFAMMAECKKMYNAIRQMPFGSGYSEEGCIERWNSLNDELQRRKDAS